MNLIVPRTVDRLLLPTERKGLHPSLVASRLETEVTCDCCPFGDSCPWHQPQSKETQATQVLQQPPTGLTGEEDAALAATWLQVQVRTQRRERAGGCGCCSSLGRQLCWGSSASGSSRFFGLPAPGVLSPFADSERAGPAEPAGAQYLAWVAGPGDAWELRGLWAGCWLVPRALEEKSLTGFQQGASTLPSHNHTPSPHKESHTLGAGPPERDHLPTKWLSFSKSLLLSEPQFPHLENGPKYIPSPVFVKCRTVPVTVSS